MRTTTAMLSMLLLTGGLYVANASAAPDPECGCRDMCAREFRACSASAVVDQKKDTLVCRTATAEDRSDCTVAYLRQLDACTGCGRGPDYAACAHKTVDDRSACMAGLHAGLMDCIAGVIGGSRSSMQDCAATRDTCVQACP